MPRGQDHTNDRRRSEAEWAALETAIAAFCGEMAPVSVRQVFYAMLVRGLIEKEDREYKRVQSRTVMMRRGGRLGWEAIVDGSRSMQLPWMSQSVDSAVNDALDAIRIDPWLSANVQVQIWIEKVALARVVEPITSRWGAPLMVARGYPSVTFLRDAAERIEAIGKPAFIYQLGDHDPSGVDAGRATEAALREFAPDADIEFERLAVLPEQIAAWRLPTRPTKGTDPRAENFNGESVELDAIPPNTLRELVQGALARHLSLRR
jgi:hypothetical protein